MCGIVGYVGNKNAAEILLDGLESLEYRGYDSAGVAVMAAEDILLLKEKGRLSNLRSLVEGKKAYANIGIGHTRWATHGVPGVKNAHPHLNGAGNIAVVHNGIIENYEILKRELMDKGYSFVSDTDTEVIVHLIDEFYEGNLERAVCSAAGRLCGSYAISVICEGEPQKIVAAREGSPLVIGLGREENFIASDIPAALAHTRNFYLLEDGEIAVVTKECVSVYNSSLEPLEKEEFQVNYSVEAAQKGECKYFMQKEILEQPAAVKTTLLNELEQIEPSFFADCERLYIVACGTAYHAGMVGKRAIEALAQIPVEVDPASEFRYREPIISEKTGVILISQSGETADTMAALRLARSGGAKILAVTNVVGSSISREADYVFYTQAGPEIAVASTKAYTSQLAAMYLIALYAARISGAHTLPLQESIREELQHLPEKIHEALKMDAQILELAKKIYKERDIYYLGRGLDYAVALEASLKLKEISYIHSDAYAGGEIKHGPIAMIEDDTVVIAVITDPRIAGKTVSNMKEVIARGAYTVGFMPESCEQCRAAFDLTFTLPEVSPLLAPLSAIVPLQLLAYHVSDLKGLDVDKPRNLAKSVTVE